LTRENDENGYVVYCYHYEKKQIRSPQHLTDVNGYDEYRTTDSVVARDVEVI